MKEKIDIKFFVGTIFSITRIRTYNLFRHNVSTFLFTSQIILIVCNDLDNYYLSIVVMYICAIFLISNIQISFYLK